MHLSHGFHELRAMVCHVSLTVELLVPLLICSQAI